MRDPGWDRDTSPYHPGEQELHERASRKEQQDRVGRRIHRPFMPDQHREFYAQLPFLLVGSVDAGGWPWASILFGPPGFVSTPDARTLKVRALPLVGDPLAANLVAGAPLGFLGIELPTRRRNRVNGVLSAEAEDGFEVKVVQSYGNCPQYIQARDMSIGRDPQLRTEIDVEAFTVIGESASAVVQQADTFFVASYNDREDKFDTGGADVNHRGGKPGFVKVDGNTLTIPDYAGNFAFNTLGNFLVCPRAGLVFIDFSTGDIWQMTGRAELLWELPDHMRGFRGAERAWKFHLEHGHRLIGASPLRWSKPKMSPNVLNTGDWEEAAQTSSSG